jgi:hypothetical protein
MFAFLAAHRAEVFPDADYADLFSPPGVGRPSLPATQMAAVLALQALHDYSDRETAEAVRFDVRWKVAIGAPLDDPGFDPSSLVYWRKRLARSERPHRVNDAVKTVIEQTGVLKARRRRAVDSTILADAVATQDTVTQLVSAIRRVGREVPGAAEQIAAVCTGHDYSRPGKPKIDWDDPEAKDALVSALVNDASALVAALADAELEEPAASAVALLALVAGQDVEPAEGSDGRDGRWRIARKVAEDRVISTVDPEARHTRKSPEARRDGYRAHVAAEPDTGIITDEALTKATGTDNSDPAVAERFLAGETTPNTGHTGDAHDTADSDENTCEWYGDSAYGTADLRDAIADAGHTAVIKPKPLQAAVEGGFTHRRLHRRRAGRHGDLSQRQHPADQHHPHSDLRCAVPHLPTAGTVHQVQDRPKDRPARTRCRVAPGPPRLGQQPRPARALPAASAQRRTDHLPDRQPRRTSCRTALPRHR